MATALAKGLVSARFTSADAILASDPLPTAREAFSRTSGCRGTDSNREVARSADVLLLAVKPGHAANAE
jgi:pyrroline-5-carboxylate reductase